MPGPYIKWFVKHCGALKISKMLDSFDDKTAIAKCIISVIGPGIEKPQLFIGEIEGTIVRPKGTS